MSRKRLLNGKEADLLTVPVLVVLRGLDIFSFGVVIVCPMKHFILFLNINLFILFIYCWLRWVFVACAGFL